MIDEQIDARLGNHRGQLLEQLDGRKAHRPRAVAPGAAEAEQERAIRFPLEGLLGNRGAQHIATEMFEPRAVARRHGDGGVQIEPLKVRMECTARGSGGCRREGRPRASPARRRARPWQPAPARRRPGSRRMPDSRRVAHRHGPPRRSDVPGRCHGSSATASKGMRIEETGLMVCRYGNGYVTYLVWRRQSGSSSVWMRKVVPRMRSGSIL